MYSVVLSWGVVLGGFCWFWGRGSALVAKMFGGKWSQGLNEHFAMSFIKFRSCNQFSLSRRFSLSRPILAIICTTFLQWSSLKPCPFWVAKHVSFILRPNLFDLVKDSRRGSSKCPFLQIIWLLCVVTFFSLHIKYTGKTKLRVSML